MARSRAQLKTELDSLRAKVTSGTFVVEDYRRMVTLESSDLTIDPDALTCSSCGKAIAHADAQVVVGVRSVPADGRKPSLPPQTYCAQHRTG